MRKNILISLFLVLVTSAGCKLTKPDLTIEQLYDSAIKDAVFAEQDEIMHLVEITKEDQNVIWNDKGQVLMCSFHAFPNSYVEGTTINTSWGEGWLTSVKEFSNWYKEEKGKFEDYKTRTIQLLGLNPDSNYTHISAFYVNPSDLYRPAFTSDITKQVTELSLPYGANQEFVTWFKENTYSSYFNSNVNYPWTRLGYTYDWAPDTDDYGLSEFILRKDSEITIVKTAEVVDFYSYLETL